MSSLPERSRQHGIKRLEVGHRRLRAYALTSWNSPSRRTESAELTARELRRRRTVCDGISNMRDQQDWIYERS
jgi:hypothetical protein